MIEVVAAIIYNDTGEIMIAKRRKGKSLEGFWEFPGGKIEAGETPEVSLKRELLEEMQVEINIEKYFDTNIHDYGDFKIKLIAFIAKITKGNIKLKDHDEIKWVTAKALKNYKIAPADIPFVEGIHPPAGINPKQLE
ncbi:8-oxo-dGTP diphosphatase MutT [Alkaliphilus transvaalensis]|uniref:8-oxo-dGTP diphosphatase MutT n=1 Tax=Alkaliphilus transvaalensis TaxID=114628 RepID=UPI000684A8A0|nr:8-oxo-dGTP diphosphatase MutT [Alkaliphilus transvaalensis]